MGKEKIRVGSLNDFPERLGKKMIVNERELALFHLSSGEIKAVENRCPHKQGPLAEGTVSGDFIFCPLHDYKICLSDGKVQEPDEGQVETFQVEVVGDEVFVWV